jgi:hypothetical protein
MIKKQRVHIEKESAILYPIVGFSEWAVCYALSTEPKECSNCGILQFPQIPFATSTWRGIQAPLHECGKQFQLIRAREIESIDGNNWKIAYSVIRGALESRDH